jgi:hypothetical protein
MHQASILMTAVVMLMGAAWVALYEFSDNSAEASEPAALELAQ